VRGRLGWLAWLAAASAAAETVAGDADRGRELFRSLGCIICHSVDGQGGGYAPDLARRIGREQTPAGMAAGLWNRSPAMWAWVRKKRLTLPAPGEQQMADFYAYFYSARYFDRPGEAERGRKVFYWKRCGDCHALNGNPAGPAPAVADWPPAGDAVGLLERMWSAAAAMKEATDRKRIPWPELSSQEASDLYALYQSLPETRQRAGDVPPSSNQPGERLFASKGCRGCHSGARTLAGRFSGRTLTDFAAALWNHAPEMARRPALSYGELRQVAGYLWSQQIREPAGDAARGKRAFAARGCASCHQKELSGAPRLAGHRVRPFALMAGLWRHGAAMQARMQEAGRTWPRLNGGELADLAAYLRTEGPF